MIYVIARSVLNPGCKEKFIEAALDNIPTVREEEGCIMYELTEDFNSGLSAQAETDENSTTFIEAWESMDHLMAHLQSSHMAKFRERITGLRKSSSLQVVSPVKR